MAPHPFFFVHCNKWQSECQYMTTRRTECTLPSTNSTETYHHHHRLSSVFHATYRLDVFSPNQAPPTRSFQCPLLAFKTVSLAGHMRCKHMRRWEREIKCWRVLQRRSVWLKDHVKNYETPGLKQSSNTETVYDFILLKIFRITGDIIVLVRPTPTHIQRPTSRPRVGYDVILPVKVGSRSGFLWLGPHDDISRDQNQDGVALFRRLASSTHSLPFCALRRLPVVDCIHRPHSPKLWKCRSCWNLHRTCQPPPVGS